MEAAIAPVVSAYLVFLAMVVLAYRRPVARRRAGPTWLGPRRHGIERSLAVTVGGGYAAFIAIVAIFHTWLGGEDDALASAIREGAILALTVFAVFVGTVRVANRRARHGDGHAE